MAKKPFAPHLLGHPQGPVAQYGNGGMLMDSDPNGSGKVSMFYLSAFIAVHD
jgi:hypothetical protein